MAESVVSLAAERLSDLLIEEARILRGVSEQVELMQIELEFMQSFLEDADKRQYEDKRVQTWVSKIREAAYDAEGVIETFALKIASRRRRGVQTAFKRYTCIINEAAELHKLGSQIDTIKTKMSNLARCLETYGIKHTRQGEEESSAHGRQRQSSQSYSHVVEEYMVGLDEDVKKLVEWLVKEEHCRFVSICGMGGLGKTTLAKEVYHNKEVRNHFDGFAWAYVSQQFQIRDIWERILFNLISPSKKQRDEILNYKDDELAKKLCDVQKEKKCLVILDDIWKTEAWDNLSPAFQVGMAGSKMLFTTRNEEIGRHVDTSCYLHKPECLKEEEGLKLLLKKAFPKKDGQEGQNAETMVGIAAQDQGEPVTPEEGQNAETKVGIAAQDQGEPVTPEDLKFSDMKKLGTEMVRRCAGLPLAIVVLGGLLATKHTYSEWEKVHKNISSYLRRAKGHEQQNSRGVSEVLAISYHELPYQLKPCFLHLAHFPEGYNIPTKKLIRMWVAEGIVSPMQYEGEGEETLEDVAESYLVELIHRCMVQVGVTGSTGTVKTCRLHDLMRDLCTLKANQENFLKLICMQDGNEPMVNFPNSSCRVRRLAIYFDGETLRNFSWVSEGSSCLRSLLFFCPDDTRLLQKMESKFNNFKLLKILDLGNCHSSKMLPRAIKKLVHLRYLSLYFYYSSDLPSSVGNLRCLQTLILDSKIGSVRLPNVIGKMEQLRHLYLPSWIRKRDGKLRLGNLSNLQTLQRFDAMCFDVKELIKLTNLRKLGITNLENIKALEKVLISPSVSLNRLCSLKIWMKGPSIGLTEIDLRGLFESCPNLYKLFLNGKIAKFPNYSHFPSNLTKLTLEGSELEQDSMKTLEELPKLSILRLYSDSFIGKEMVCSSKGFPQLKSLLLLGLPNLEKWHMGEEAMPKLCELIIERCMNLEGVPDRLGSITTLQELQIVDMPVDFKIRFQAVSFGGEDLYKVQHIPSIIIEEDDDWL